MKPATTDIKNKGKVKLSDQLDVTKFLACEVWEFLFQNQIKRIQTNNCGTFFLFDDNFRFLARLSSDNPESKDFKNKVQVFESFLIGIVRGALQNLGNEPAPEVKMAMTKQNEADQYPTLHITVKYVDKS